MSAHDHPGLSNITNLAVAVALLQRVLSVHEIASCHFDLRSFDVVNVPLVDGTAAFLREIGLRGVLEVGLQKTVRSRRAACRCSRDHVDIRCISGHLEDAGGICPLSSDDPRRAAPSALERHMRRSTASPPCMVSPPCAPPPLSGTIAGSMLSGTIAGSM